MVVDVILNDLVPLMFRPAWPQASMSAHVKTSASSLGPDGPRELSGGLQLAPGGRYRADLTDEDGDRTLTICDGTTTWVINDASGNIFREPLEVPFRKLLNPAWILADFRFEVVEETGSLGRTAYAISGSRRETSRSRKTLDIPGDHVNAVIDAALGVLLRYEIEGPGRRSEFAEFTLLELGSPEEFDPSCFCPPEGIQFTEHSPAGRDHPVPAAVLPGQAGGALDNNAINVLNRSGMKPQTLSAELHEWADGNQITRSITDAIPDSSPRWITELDQLSQGTAPGIFDLTAAFQVAMPGHYKIEMTGEPLPGKPTLVSCDGEQVWRVFNDRVTIGPAAMPPAGVALLVDPSWLLYGYQLSSGGVTSVSGRSGLHIIAQRTDEAPPEGEQGPLTGLSLLADRIETVIDLELGIGLYQTWYLNGKVLLRTELNGLSENVDIASFRIDPPSGLRVVRVGVIPSAVKEAGEVASRVAGGIARMLKKR